ncbi:MAG TPA: hypothetical protein VNJ04_02805 [Gemmatimonadaceae bacterium]|nr:hypothetical protein [Gemmatimonadaceae bacterium]
MAPGWVVAAAHEAAVMERNALKFLYEVDDSAQDDVEAARTVLRLARGIRRKLEWWQRREETAISKI